MKLVLAACWILVLSFGIGHATELPLVVQYRNKPPYSFTKAGKPSGFLIERTAEILKLAGIQASLQEVPVKRINENIKENRSPICFPSPYKLPERELYARFTLPIHQDEPHMVLADAQAADKVKAYKSIKDLFASPELRLGKVSGVSYGPELDAMISSTALAAMDSTITPLGLARMIQAHRADYMLIDVEDYNFLTQTGDAETEGLVPIKFTDMPAGLKRYIMCSLSVSPQTMAKLDKAIAQVSSKRK